MEKLKNILKHYHITYDEFRCENPKTLTIKACKICEPVHSYLDWTDNPEEDYTNWNFELLEILQPFIDNGYLVILECDSCCGCGDW